MQASEFATLNSPLILGRLTSHASVEEWLHICLYTYIVISCSVVYAVRVKDKTYIRRSDPSPKPGSIGFAHSVAMTLIPLTILTRIRSCALEDAMLLADAMLAMRRDRKVAWNVFIVVVKIGMCSATIFRRLSYISSVGSESLATGSA